MAEIIRTEGILLRHDRQYRNMAGLRCRILCHGLVRQRGNQQQRGKDSAHDANWLPVEMSFHVIPERQYFLLCKPYRKSCAHSLPTIVASKAAMERGGQPPDLRAAPAKASNRN